MIDPCKQPEPEVTLPTVCLNDLVHTEEPHEPPIGFEDGSLSITWDLNLIETILPPIPNDPRPFKYVLADSSVFRGPIAVARILTETDSGTVCFVRYILPETSQARILIWLQQLASTSPTHPPVFEPKPTQAQLFLRGGNRIGGQSFLIETDRALSLSHETHKLHRRFGFEHPGFQRHFRIAAWAIVHPDGNCVHENNDPFGQAFRDSGQDGYKIYLSFHH